MTRRLTRPRLQLQGASRPRSIEARTPGASSTSTIVPVAGLAAGMPLGVVAFQQFDEAQLRVAIGAVLVLAVIVVGATQQLDEVTDFIEERDYRPGKVAGATAGFLAGILGGSVAVPGPPMIVYGAFMSASGFWSNEEMKSVFTAFFGTLMLYRLASLAYSGAVTLPLLTEAAIAMPMVFVGAWLGVYVFDHVPEGVFQWIVLALLTVNAFVLLFTAVPEL
ncbi:MAG: TSUP family transporter [Halanaeroarchaeum sp.]